MKLSHTVLSFRAKLRVQAINLARPHQSILNHICTHKGACPRSSLSQPLSHHHYEFMYDVVVLSHKNQSCVSASVGILSQKEAMYSKRKSLLGSTWPKLNKAHLLKNKIEKIANWFPKTTWGSAASTSWMASDLTKRVTKENTGTWMKTKIYQHLSGSALWHSDHRNKIYPCSWMGWHLDFQVAVGSLAFRPALRLNKERRLAM